MATPNYEGWSCPYGQSRFGAVTKVWEEQEEWTVGGWVKRIRKSDLKENFWAIGGEESSEADVKDFGKIVVRQM